MNAIVREPKCLKRSNKVTDTESSKISCGIRIMRMHSLTNTNMHSLSKMTKPYSQENKTRQRKFRLQMSIAKCYKAESLKLKPHNSYAEASFCCADIQANLLSHGIFPLRSFLSCSDTHQTQATFSYAVRVLFSCWQKDTE